DEKTALNNLDSGVRRLDVDRAVIHAELLCVLGPLRSPLPEAADAERDAHLGITVLVPVVRAVAAHLFNNPALPRPARQLERHGAAANPLVLLHFHLSPRRLSVGRLAAACDVLPGVHFTLRPLPISLSIQFTDRVSELRNDLFD